MEFTTIQDKETKQIIMHYLDGTRVTKAKYKEEDQIKTQQGKRFCSFLTNRTQSGNFRHTKYNFI